MTPAVFLLSRKVRQDLFGYDKIVLNESTYLDIITSLTSFSFILLTINLFQTNNRKENKRKQVGLVKQHLVANTICILQSK